MTSASQDVAHAAMVKKTSKRKKKPKGSLPFMGDQSVNASDTMSHSTPVNRFAARRHVDPFSPFSFRSSQASPRPEQPASPSIILFSGPAQRGFERVHDDSFPQNLHLLKNMARSKFKLPPSASIEMSYVNPDGVVCELDDEHDLRALAVHATLTQKLKVNVVSSATAGVLLLSQSIAETQPPSPFTNGTSAPALSTSSPDLTLEDSPASSKRKATVSATSALPQANERSKKKSDPVKAPQESSVKSMPSRITPADAAAAGTCRWEDREDPAALVARLFPNPVPSAASEVRDAAATSASHTQTSAPVSQPDPSAVEQASNSASSPALPAIKKASGKRKRVDNSPTPPPTLTSASQPKSATTDTPSSPSGPAAKRPKGRPKKSLVPEATASIPTASEAAVTESTAAPVAVAPTTEAPASNEATAGIPAVSEVVVTELTAAPTTEAPAPVENGPTDTQSSAASQVVARGVTNQEQAASEPVKRSVGRPKKAAAAPATPSAAPSIPSQSDAETTTPAGKLRGRPPKKALADADTTAPAGKRRGRPPKKALADAEAAAQAAAPTLEAASTAAPTDAQAEQRGRPPKKALADADTTAPAGKRRGRPPKKALADAEAAAQAAAPTLEAASVAAPTDAQAERPAETPGTFVPSGKKGARATKATTAAKAGAAPAEPDAASQNEATTASVTEPPLAPVAEQQGEALQVPADEVMKDVDATQPPTASQENQSVALSASATSKRSAAAKPRASKATAAAKTSVAAVKAVEAADACVVCRATPNHEKENCSVWQGGSQTILDLLDMIRKKDQKSQQEKESTKILDNWLSQQLGVPQQDHLPSQAQAGSSQQSAVESNVGSSQSAADAPEATQDSAKDEDAQEPESATAAKKAAKSKAVGQKRQTATKKHAKASAASEPELPPPSGVEASTSATVAVSASAEKPSGRATRGQSKKAAAAAGAKAAKPACKTSEPRIALTPSSPPHPTTSQSTEDASPGLRAPSESSEAELATSPMLCAVPRSNDDMDVDPLPTPPQSSTAVSAAQQLEERNRKMKMADRGARGSGASLEGSVAAGKSRSRSRSASITSSDTSHGGDSSDDDSEGGSDGDVSKSRKEVAKLEKTGSGKASRSPAVPARTRRVTAEPQASSSSPSSSDSSDSSSSSSETESEAETASEAASTQTTKEQSRPTRAVGNPFLRGLTPLSNRQASSNGKPSSFTRLSDLKPATLRQNLSQPGSPLSTGGSTPLGANGQTGFFSQPVANGATETHTDTAAVTATATEAGTGAEKQQSESEYESDSSIDMSSSDDEAPIKGRGAVVRKRAGGAVAKPKKKKNNFAALFG